MSPAELIITILAGLAIWIVVALLIGHRLRTVGRSYPRAEH